MFKGVKVWIINEFDPQYLVYDHARTISNNRPYKHICLHYWWLVFAFQRLGWKGLGSGAKHFPTSHLSQFFFLF